MNNFHNIEEVQESDTEADLAIPIKKKKKVGNSRNLGDSERSKRIMYFSK